MRKIGHYIQGYPLGDAYKEITTPDQMIEKMKNMITSSPVKERIIVAMSPDEYEAIMTLKRAMNKH